MSKSEFLLLADVFLPHERNVNVLPFKCAWWRRRAHFRQPAAKCAVITCCCQVNGLILQHTCLHIAAEIMTSTILLFTLWGELRLLVRPVQCLLTLLPFSQRTVTQKVHRRELFFSPYQLATLWFLSRGDQNKGGRVENPACHYYLLKEKRQH